MNTTEDFTATKIDGLKRVCEGLPINIDDLAKTQFQSHSERIIKNDGWGVSERLINYPAVSITSNKITSLTKDLSKRAIICRIGAKIDNERGAKNSKRVNESMSELTTAFYGEYVRRMLVCIDEMTIEMRENANGKEYFPDIFYPTKKRIIFCENSATGAVLVFFLFRTENKNAAAQIMGSSIVFCNSQRV